jgi:hypothetical protein
MTSAKQKSANQRNSQHSTGPRTEEGKTAVKPNALKHGLIAETHCLPWEDPEEYEMLHQDYIEHYQPIGREETELVERIASLRWRLKRVPAYETAIITSGCREKGSGPVGVFIVNVTPYEDEMGGKEETTGSIKKNEEPSLEHVNNDSMNYGHSLFEVMPTLALFIRWEKDLTRMLSEVIRDFKNCQAERLARQSLADGPKLIEQLGK